MTYREYIKATYDNCKKALSDCTMDQLSDLEKVKRILWEDDRVTEHAARDGKRRYSS